MIGDVRVGEAGSKGKGVFALKAFLEGEFIFRRRHGRVLTTDELAGLSEDDQRHICELGWDRVAILLPPGCYLNHSCDPNAMRSGVRVFAWRNIQAGEEITIDYRLNAFADESWPCSCGSDGCSGTVQGSFFALPAEIQARYAPHAPRFIQRELRRRRGSR